MFLPLFTYSTGITIGVMDVNPLSKSVRNTVDFQINEWSSHIKQSKNRCMSLVMFVTMG